MNNDTKDLQQHKSDFFLTLLECISDLTGTPIGMYEIRNGEIEEVIPETSRANYEPYCKLIQSYSDGKKRCEADQLMRATKALKHYDGTKDVCCWAGVYNKNIIVKINDKPKALIVYGDMKTEESQIQLSALKHEKAMNLLKVTESEKVKLKQALSVIKKYDSEKIKHLNNLISRAESLIYVFEQEYNKSKFVVERNSHEINTRLQVVLAHASNLREEIKAESYEDAKEISEGLIKSTSSLNTVVQNLDDYLEEYKFEKQSLLGLINESIEIYQVEANRRHIDVRVDISRGDNPVDISRHHFQYVLNNLIHNAVKYSFRGTNEKKRYVSIDGWPMREYYNLTITNYGVGILPMELSKIFDDGYQGKLTRKEYRTGSGKGLHFVKRTIKRHNGKIYAESTLVADEETPYGKPHVNKFTIQLPYYQQKGRK